MDSRTNGRRNEGTNTPSALFTYEVLTSVLSRKSSIIRVRLFESIELIAAVRRAPDELTERADERMSV